MSEHNKIDDLFKRNEKGLNREPSDSAWNKLDRMLPKEDEKSVVDPLTERVKSFEKPNPRIVKSPVPTWVRYAAVFALFSIPLAAFLAFQNNSPVDTALAESKKTSQQREEIVAMNEKDADQSFTIDGIGLNQAAADTGGDSNPTENKESTVTESKSKRFGDINKMKESIGNKGTTRPPVLNKPVVPKQDDRLNTGTPLPSQQTQSSNDDIDLEVNKALAQTEETVNDVAQTEQGYPIVHGMPSDQSAEEIAADDLNPFRSNFDRQYKNPHTSVDNLDKQYRSDHPSSQIEAAEEVNGYALEESIELKDSDADLNDDSLQWTSETSDQASKKNASPSKEAVEPENIAISQSSGLLFNDRVVAVHSKLGKFYGTWQDDEGVNKYDIIQTGPNTASVDVYRDGKLSRNYQLLDTVEGITMMLYDNEANQGTTEYLVQSMNDKNIQFFLPSDPTNLVRFELKKKKLIVTEQRSATESNTFKLKKLE